MKIIFHIKQDYLTDEEKSLIEKRIKEFHNKSLIVYGEEIDIIILNENKNENENN